jgi:TRAP-type C4-dicarboxylate transport system permease small subunit
MARHPADLLSLLAGLLALGFGLVLLTGGIGDLAMEWVGPAVATGLGALILFAARPAREASEQEPASADEGHP